MTQEQRNISELERNAEYHARQAESLRKSYVRYPRHEVRQWMRNHQEQCAYYAAQIPA